MGMTASATVACAQTTPLYDPAQLPEVKGTVQAYSLTPRGDVDGLILNDGTEVHFPPHMSAQLVFAVKPGDAVTVHGLRRGPCRSSRRHRSPTMRPARR